MIPLIHRTLRCLVVLEALTLIANFLVTCIYLTAGVPTDPYTT